MAEHTKGPWKQRPPGEWKDEYYGWDYQVGPAVLFVSKPPTPEQLANARLIAAAPEMLAAMRAMLPFIAVAPEKLIDEYEAAISKARGVDLHAEYRRRQS